jgi:hypothetical protein
MEIGTNANHLPAWSPWSWSRSPKCPVMYSDVQWVWLASSHSIGFAKMTSNWDMSWYPLVI